MKAPNNVTERVIINEQLENKTPKIGKILCLDCENNAGIPVPNPIKLKKSWSIAMLPIIWVSCSIAAEIHTPRNNTIAIKETQKEIAGSCI